jgi:hypothetical protein
MSPKSTRTPNPRPTPTIQGAPADGFGLTYRNTLIQVSPDSTAVTGMVPAPRGGKLTIPQLEYQLISAQPYALTQDEVQFEVHVRHRGFQPRDLKERRHQLLADFFGHSRACLRVSSLPKTYGWGIHFDGAGRVALYAVDSPEYRRLSQDPAQTLLYAMRSARDQPGASARTGSGKGLATFRDALRR